MALKDMKESLSSARKADTTHVRRAFQIYTARPCEYGTAKGYERGNYRREVGDGAHPNAADFERFGAYLRAARDHLDETLDAMERHRANDPKLQDVEGMKRAAYAVDTDAMPGAKIGASLLPHIAASCSSLNMAITQATDFGLLPRDPGPTWVNGIPEGWREPAPTTTPHLESMRTMLEGHINKAETREEYDARTGTTRHTVPAFEVGARVRTNRCPGSAIADAAGTLVEKCPIREKTWVVAFDDPKLSSLAYREAELSVVERALRVGDTIRKQNCDAALGTLVRVELTARFPYGVKVRKESDSNDGIAWYQRQEISLMATAFKAGDLVKIVAGPQTGHTGFIGLLGVEPGGLVNIIPNRSGPPLRTAVLNLELVSRVTPETPL